MMDKILRFRPDERFQVIKTLDMHTAGEPLRIITSGLPEIPGNTILEKRRFFKDHLDHIRTGLMHEPRGHADMYGAVITPPVTPDGHFGTFFLHNEGYSTMCGHAMIALTKMAVETGLVPPETKEIKIDAPPGRITARAEIENGKVRRSFFKNVPSFVLLSNQVVKVPGIGNVSFDVAYGGAFYAFVDVAPLGLKMDASGYSRLIDFGRRIKMAVMEQFEIRHPFEPDLSFLYGTIFTGLPETKGNHSRNVCIFADGEVDRSPTGSGVSARAALHFHRGDLTPGEKATIESIIGSTMTVEIVETLYYGPYSAVIPEVSGTSSFTGTHEFWFDPEDPFRYGFFLR
jgi:trans-L-3-hydroxyproline dehydratase